MGPFLATDDSNDGASIDAKLLSKFDEGNGGCFKADATNDIIGQFRGGAFFALIVNKFSAPFDPHVMVIVFDGAKEKMIQAATGWIVTVVTYAHAFWDWAIRHFPNKAMDANSFSLADDQTVAGMIMIARPGSATSLRARLSFQTKASFQRRFCWDGWGGRDLFSIRGHVPIVAANKSVRLALDMPFRT